MELDPAVVGGVVAGVVGLSLGIGAMVWTEKQTIRRAERKVSDPVVCALHAALF
jgi:hypothetical protein